MKDRQKDLIGSLVSAEKHGRYGISYSMLVVVYEPDEGTALDLAKKSFPDHDAFYYVCEAPRDIIERHKLKPGETKGWRNA